MLISAIVLRCSFFSILLGLDAFSLLLAGPLYCGKLIIVLLEVITAFHSDRKRRFGTRLDAHNSDVAPGG